MCRAWGPRWRAGADLCWLVPRRLCHQCAGRAGHGGRDVCTDLQGDATGPRAVEGRMDRRCGHSHTRYPGQIADWAVRGQLGRGDRLWRCRVAGGDFDVGVLLSPDLPGWCRIYLGACQYVWVEKEFAVNSGAKDSALASLAVHLSESPLHSNRR